MRLGLGTAQLGMDYGVTNRRGQPADAEALAWLDRAYRGAIDFLDTAPGYGSAERIIGAATRAGCRFSVITKIPALGAGSDARSFIREAVKSSLAQLGVDSLEGVLLHRWQDALGPQGPDVIRELRQVRDDGLVRHVGVSVYRAADIEQVLRQFRPDIVQLPFSALDQRLARSGHLQRLRDAGVHVHARSIFLQGALLSQPKDLPAFLDGLRPALEQFRALARENSLSELEAALAFVAHNQLISAMIVGVSRREELEALLEAFAAARTARSMDLSSIAPCVPENLLDLDRWPSPRAAAPAQ